MKKQSIETAITLLLEEDKTFKIYTDITKNLGVNGQEPMSFFIGQKSVNNSDENYYSENSVELLSDDLVKIIIYRITWSLYDKNRTCAPTKTFDNTIFLDISSITHISLF